MAKAAKLKVALISGRYSSSTDHRAKELNIQEVYNGYLNKIPAYKELKKKYKLSNHEIAYIGDDLIDIPIMEQVGFPISVNDANVKVNFLQEMTPLPFLVYYACSPFAIILAYLHLQSDSQLVLFAISLICLYHYPMENCRTSFVSFLLEEMENGRAN